MLGSEKAGTNGAGRSTSRSERPPVVADPSKRPLRCAPMVAGGPVPTHMNSSKNIEPFDEHRARFEKTIRDKGFTLRQLSVLMGRNQAYFHQYVYKGKPEHLGSADVDRLCEILKMGRAEIMGPSSGSASDCRNAAVSVPMDHPRHARLEMFRGGEGGALQHLCPLPGQAFDATNALTIPPGSWFSIIYAGNDRTDVPAYLRDSLILCEPSGKRPSEGVRVMVSFPSGTYRIGRMGPNDTVIDDWDHEHTLGADADVCVVRAVFHRF